MPSPSRRLAPFTATAALMLAAAGAGCRAPDDPDPEIRFVAVVLPDTVLRPGRSMQPIVEVLDIGGRPLEGKTVTWRSLTPATLQVLPLGGQWVLIGLATGIGRAKVTAGSISEIIEIPLANPPTASITVALDTVRLLLPSGALQLMATARDSDGVAIVDPDLRWESGAARIADVTGDGRVTAIAAGRTDIIATSGARADTAIALIAAPKTQTSPAITGVSPTFVEPAQPLVLTGSGFAATASGNAVLVDGIPATVTAAGPSQITVVLPAAAQFACRATGPATVQVTTSGGIGTFDLALQVAPQRALSPGEVVVLATPREARCLELVPAAGRYLVTVQNVARVRSTSGTTPIALTLGGASTATGEATLAMPAATSVVRDRLQARARVHERVLEANARTGSARVPPSGTAQASATAITAPLLGDVVPVRIPNIESVDQCANYTAIGARVAFVGPHVVILEDTQPNFNGAPTMRGIIDAELAALGAEFEQVVWPIVTRFGNPLAMDSRLDANGRIAIVLTPRLNLMAGGSALALTVTCDLFARAQEPSSNVGEYVYTQVPLRAGTGPNSLERWKAEIRATIAHEVKHIVSNAERLIRTFPSEDLWLDEAMARVAEELFGREIYGIPQGNDAGYDASLRCEIFLGASGSPCPDSPRAVLPHLEGLFEYLATPAARSPFGEGPSGDVSYYGSGWSLVRWVIDRSGRPENDVIRELTVTPLVGIANLEARSGRTWETLLGEWSIAMAVEGSGRPETQLSTAHRFISWDLPSAFGGLCLSIGTCGNPDARTVFTRTIPLQPIEVPIGGLAVEFPSILPGGFGVIELQGGATNLRQLLQLRGYRGGPIPADARVAIIRID